MASPPLAPPLSRPAEPPAGDRCRALRLRFVYAPPRVGRRRSVRPHRRPDDAREGRAEPCRAVGKCSEEAGMNDLNRCQYEKDNDVSDFDGLILWSDNHFYKDFNLDKKRYMYGYLFLKPDSATYINEIESVIENFDLEIIKKYLINNFDEVALQFYQEKDDDYKFIIKRHIDNLVYLFGKDALIYVLDGDGSYQKLLDKIYNLKLEIRRQFGFTEKEHGYILRDDNVSHLNLRHCPDPLISLFERDLSIIENLDKLELSNSEHKILKKYRSYHL